MKDSHLTLRLPVALVRALVRRAREAGVARSHLVREAVTAYLAGPPASASAAPRHEVTAADLVGRWRTLPRLEPEEATSFARDLTDARASLPVPPGWE